MAVIFSQPITLHSGQTVSPGIALADDVITVRATLTHWNGVNTTDCFIELSFDGGATWKPYGGVGPTSAPSGTFKNRLDLWVQIQGIWKICGFVFPADSRYRPGQTCGEVYVPGTGTVQTTIHSDWAHQDTTPLSNLSTVNFHNPDLTPATGLPFRQIRVICNASGNINSQLVVEAS